MGDKTIDALVLQLKGKPKGEDEEMDAGHEARLSAVKSLFAAMKKDDPKAGLAALEECMSLYEKSEEPMPMDDED